MTENKKFIYYYIFYYINLYNLGNSIGNTNHSLSESENSSNGRRRSEKIKIFVKKRTIKEKTSQKNNASDSKFNFGLSSDERNNNNWNKRNPVDLYRTQRTRNAEKEGTGTVKVILIDEAKED